MNKFLVLLSIIGLVFFAACSSEEKQEPETQDTESQEMTTDDTQADTQDKMTDTETEEEVVAGKDTEKKEEAKEDTKAVSSASGDYTSNPLEGYVISLKDAAFGADGKINKSEAQKLVSEGKTIAFKSGNNIYMVYHENGAYAGEKMINYANRNKVGLYGKAKAQNGVNAFILTRIVSLD